MTVQLEFTDCLGCGKRVATTAAVCRHCNTKRTSSLARKRTSVDEAENDSGSDSESHAALGLGGYGTDDFDDETEPVSKKKNLWWYVAWVLLIFFALSALFPFLF